MTEETSRKETAGFKKRSAMTALQVGGTYACFNNRESIESRHSYNKHPMITDEPDDLFIVPDFGYVNVLHASGHMPLGKRRFLMLKEEVLWEDAREDLGVAAKTIVQHNNIIFDSRSQEHRGLFKKVDGTSQVIFTGNVNRNLMDALIRTKTTEMISSFINSLLAPKDEDNWSRSWQSLREIPIWLCNMIANEILCGHDRIDIDAKGSKKRASSWRISQFYNTWAIPKDGNPKDQKLMASLMKLKQVIEIWKMCAATEKYRANVSYDALGSISSQSGASVLTDALKDMKENTNVELMTQAFFSGATVQDLFAGTMHLFD